VKEKQRVKYMVSRDVIINKTLDDYNDKLRRSRLALAFFKKTLEGEDIVDNPYYKSLLGTFEGRVEMYESIVEVLTLLTLPDSAFSP